VKTFFLEPGIPCLIAIHTSGRLKGCDEALEPFSRALHEFLERAGMCLQF